MDLVRVPGWLVKRRRGSIGSQHLDEKSDSSTELSTRTPRVRSISYQICLAVLRLIIILFNLLYSEALAVLSATRSTSLMNLFLDALTRGGPNGLPRPIELNAHDPIRYVGDMLAWVHQTMASEHEFLESLFDLKSDGRRVGEFRIFSPNSATQSIFNNTNDTASGTEMPAVDLQGENRKRARTLLDKHMEGCGRPLKVRVYQTIKSQEGSIVAYQLATLLDFYKATMASTIGPQALLTNTLSELSQFFTLQNGQTCPYYCVHDFPG